MRFVTPGQLREIIRGEDEFALLDVRERNPFSREHLLLSSRVPLSRIEILAGTMVPRLSTKVIVTGEGPSDEHRLDERAFRRLRELGYTAMYRFSRVDSRHGAPPGLNYSRGSAPTQKPSANGLRRNTRHRQSLPGSNTAG